MNCVTIETRKRIGSDGILHIEVPEAMRDREVSVKLSLEADDVEMSLIGSEASKWPAGFFAATAGSIPDLERWPQGEYDSRSEW